MALDLSSVFQKAHSEKRIALIGYLPAGYPDPAQFLKLAETAFASGLDILEIGLPSRNTVLDGEIIRAAMNQVNNQGVSVADALSLGGKTLQQDGSAGLVMMYADTLVEYGSEQMLRCCQQLGISGILLPDMAVAAWLAFAQKAHRHHIAPVGFLTPATDGPSQQAICQHAGGFIYLQRHVGPTGQHREFDDGVKQRISRVQACARTVKLPVAVGFGIRTPVDVQYLKMMGADGAVIGTAFVEAAEQGYQALGQFVRSLAKATYF